MFSLSSTSRSDSAVLKALDRSLAIIEFDPTGKILKANANFCNAMGYTLAEIEGKHHSLFVDPDYSKSADYREFWAKLGRGEFDAREYLRIGKGGKEVWIQASYNPVLGSNGKVVKVVKVASDITAEKLRNAEFEGKIKAASRVQAIIEFKPSGEIITANENFLKTLGYTLGEIQGRHHRMFVEPSYAQSSEYTDFWHELNSGNFVESEFKRIGKGGKEVWISASYNPIFDHNHKVVKIVKFATDATARIFAVDEIAKGLAALANNNLCHRLNIAFDPALEKLRLDLNAAADKLQNALSSIASTTDSVRTSAEEIAIASDDLSQRTEQQAANLEETAAALDEITATVKRSAGGAKLANVAASAAKADAVRSGEVMKNAIAAMSEIEKSSGQITQIISVIDEIAFQTNLLALNAGVEAARAGDAGRGFAVVAQEVRALSRRSADAAKEIKDLIATSSDQVKPGVRLVGDTGQALTEIVTKVTEIDTLISDIAHSSQEQATGLGEVNTAVNQMDQITQQNAAMVEEATAAAANLKSKADELNALVAQFDIGTGARRSKSVEVARPGHHRAANNPVAKAQARIATAMRSGGAAQAEWQEF